MEGATSPSDALSKTEPAPPTPEKDSVSSRQRESSDPSATRSGNWAGGRLNGLTEGSSSSARRPSAEDALGDEWVRGFDLSPGATAEDRLPGVKAIGLGFGNLEKEGFNKVRPTDEPC